MDLKIALAGNANVGKSVLMNRLTGVGVIVSNYPGTTVELTRGKTKWKNKKIEIIDLPGTYSLDAGSEDEQVAVSMILEEKPDVIVNVIDATNLERNLYLTLQLIELGFPLVVALNQMDRVHARGMEIKVKKLEKLLGVPVIPIVAISGVGVHDLVEAAVSKSRISRFRIDYDYHIEQAIDTISKKFDKSISIPKKTFVLGLLLNNPVLVSMVDEDLSNKVAIIRKGIEDLHGESILVHASRDRFGICGEVGRAVIKSFPRPSLSEKISQLTLTGPTAFLVMFLTFLASFMILIEFGGYLEEEFMVLFEIFDPVIYSVIGKNFLTEGVVVGLEAGISIVIPYILTFYLILGILEDSGYLPRVAALLDNFMHKIDLHGKAIIPILLGYGCNVPAVLSTRILSSKKERLITAFIICLTIPCSAQTSIILGLVGHYLGLLPALSIYLMLFILLLVVGKLLAIVLPGKEFGLVIELPPYRLPDTKAVLTKTYLRVREFLFIALPLIIVGSIVLTALRQLGLLTIIQEPLVPVTSALGLPELTAVPFVYGLLRKEMTLQAVALLAGTTDFTKIFTPVQMFVFSLVMAIYMPCIATIAALLKEFGVRDTILITLFTILFAIFAGVLANFILIYSGLL